MQAPWKLIAPALPRWPSLQDYREAMQCPSQNFLDPDLASGQIAIDKLGLPRPASGNFASVYKVRCDGKLWAVRCFLQNKLKAEHYHEIQKTIRLFGPNFLMPFQYQENGLIVAGRAFPIMKMEWCRGEPLNEWIGKHLLNQDELYDFLQQWRKLVSELRSFGIAHGDLQHDNILIEKDGSIKLIDYDCMYVPQFEGEKSPEVGHANYQHPDRFHGHFGPYLDNFSAWLIQISVAIIGLDPSLWSKHKGGDECLLFRHKDLLYPEHSALFRDLDEHSDARIRKAAQTIKYFLTLPPEEIPDLEVTADLPFYEYVRTPEPGRQEFNSESYLTSSREVSFYNPRMVGSIAGLFVCLLLSITVWLGPEIETRLFWKGNQYYLLVEGVEKRFNRELAKGYFRQGLIDLRTSNDKRALLSRCLLYYYLGLLEAETGELASAVQNLTSAQTERACIGSGYNIPSQAQISIDLARVYELQRNFVDAEAQYKSAVSSLKTGAIVARGESLDGVLDSLIKILEQQQYKSTEVAEYKQFKSALHGIAQTSAELSEQVPEYQ